MAKFQIHFQPNLFATESQVKSIDEYFTDYSDAEPIVFSDGTKVYVKDELDTKFTQWLITLDGSESVVSDYFNMTVLPQLTFDETGIHGTVEADDELFGPIFTFMNLPESSVFGTVVKLDS